MAPTPQSPEIIAAAAQPQAAEPTTSASCDGCGRKLKVRAELLGKKIKCPKCKKTLLMPLPPPPPPSPEDDIVMAEPDDDEATYVEAEPDVQASSVLNKVMSIAAAVLIILTVAACSTYANLSFLVTKPADYKYFPPFVPGHHEARMNRHLGAEYHEIAKSIVRGDGFGSPFKEKTGPTAWMPPILPYLTAALIYLCDNNTDAVMTVILFFQGCTLAFTGLIVLILARQTTRLWALLIVSAFVIGLVSNFRLWFQNTHDCWFVLLALNLVVVGFVWCNPMGTWPGAIAWGLYGGVCAMINPIVALVWGVLTITMLARERAWVRFGVICMLAMLTITPWVVRNYLVFGRFIPVKSNASYEFWQSQCITPDGLLQPSAFGSHPYANAGRERRLYKEMGEMEFLDKKRELFWQEVKKDPVDFLDRIACRFLGATLWYVPFNRGDVLDRPYVVWTYRILHPLPFLALLFLAASAIWKPLNAAQWGVMLVYVLYLSPYIAISYYERYAIPLLGVKVLLVIWGLDRVLTLILMPLARLAFQAISWIVMPKQPKIA
jgi:hypothetical protein